MKVASIQFCPTFLNKERNLKKMGSLIRTAANAGAKLIVLPELATTGYSFMDEDQAKESAEVLTLEKSRTMQVMQALSLSFNVCIVWGMVEEDPGSKKLFNSQVFIDPDGFYTSYRKVNRWGNDFLWASAGISNPPVVHSKFLGCTVGLLICRDVRDKVNEDWKNFYSPGDAKIVCLSSNWGDGGFPAVSWMDFATENKVCLIVSNRYGQEGPNNFGEGGVCVISAEGKVCAKGLVFNSDCVVTSEV